MNNISTKIIQVLNEGTYFDFMEYMLRMRDTKEILKEKGLNADDVLKDIIRNFSSKLSEEDKNLIKVLGWGIKDIEVSEPTYGTSDVVSSSFSEYVDYRISCIATIGQNEEVPLDFDYRYVYNSYSGGWN